MNFLKILSLATLFSLFPIHLHAQSAKKSSPPLNEPTQEQRQKMAEMHTQMAECLKSEKSFEECHQQMRESCSISEGEMCAMMGMRRVHRGMMWSKDEKPKSDKKSK